MEKAVLGAGCFWGVEAAFRQVNGVLSTRVGYSGGTTTNPTYPDVCSDQTGHAEVVEVTFDPDKVSYTELLDQFWECHDPTQLNRQGPDKGSQYRSVIFCVNAEQKTAAIESRRRREQLGRYSRPIVTQIETLAEFWEAEEYHQRYLEKKGGISCH